VSDRAATRPRTTGLLGAFDQLVFSFGNLVFFFVLARETDMSTFGFVATGMLIYETTQLALRGLFAQSASLIFPTLTGTRTRELARSMMSNVLAIAVAATVIVIGVERIFLNGDQLEIMNLVALLFVPIMLQEGTRSIAFATRRPAVALRSDLVWTAIQIVGSVVLISFDAATGPRLLCFSLAV